MELKADMDIIWDTDKDKVLIASRGIGFNDVVNAINNDRVVDIQLNPNQERYPGQYILILEISNYIYYVPFKVKNNQYILITVIPSRKLTKDYLK